MSPGTLRGSGRIRGSGGPVVFGRVASSQHYDLLVRTLHTGPEKSGFTNRLTEGGRMKKYLLLVCLALLVFTPAAFGQEGGEAAGGLGKNG